MKLIEINWNPTHRQLRQFGLVGLVALPAVAWIWGGSTTTVLLFGAIGLVLACAGVVVPKSLKPIFLGLTLVATPIGIVVGEVAMLLIYFGLFSLFGLVFRVIKRDVLQLRLDRNAETYWQAKKQATSAASYYRQS